MEKRPIWIPLVVGMVVGGLLGKIFFDWGGTLLAAVGGGILGWAHHKRAYWEALRGGLLGAFFLCLVGPGCDYLISRTPLEERLVPAAVTGLLVGSLLGVRNSRRRKSLAAPHEETTDGSHPGS